MKKLFEDYPISFGEIARRAYKRGLYFRALLVANHGNLAKDDLEMDDFAARELISNLKMSGTGLTPAQEANLQEMLLDIDPNENEFRLNAINYMENAVESSRDIRTDLNDVSNRMDDMKRKYDSDLKIILKVLKDLRQGKVEKASKRIGYLV